MNYQDLKNIIMTDHIQLNFTKLEPGMRFSVKYPYPATYYIHRITKTKVSVGKVFTVEGNEKLSNYLNYIPKESFPHMFYDLNGTPIFGDWEGGPHPKDWPEAIYQVRQATADFLGKGYSGLCFRWDDKVVKVSTTVPFHPDTQSHRTIQESITETHNEYQVSQILLAKEVPGILPTEYYQIGEKAFIIRPYCDLPEDGQLSEAQCMMVAATIRKIHRLNYAYLDSIIEVGLWNGLPFLFDLGLAQKIPPKNRHTKKDWIEKDCYALARLFEKHGHTLPWSAARKRISDKKIERFRNQCKNTTTS